MATLENFLYQAAEAVSRARSKEPAITIGKNSIDIEFVDPKEAENRAWDSSNYSFGNLFVSGYSNSLKLVKEDIEDGETKLMPSSKYRNFMKSKVIQEAFYADAMENKKMIYLLFASLAMNIVTLLAVVAVAA